MNALHGCSMSQHLNAVAVANGINALHAGFKMLINNYAPTLITLNSCALNNSHTWLAPHSHENNISLNHSLLALAFEGYTFHAVGSVGNRLYSRLHEKLHTSFLNTLAQTLGNIIVNGRQTLLEKLHHRYLAAKSIEDAGKLHTDDASPNNAQMLWQTLYGEQAGSINNSALVDVAMRRQL